ncbi:MAG TPA: hypothetical protein VK972_09035 [Wenzhouxiangella sp.]|nr:hypothetical protein [Wenzhouxiangella sp.]
MMKLGKQTIPALSIALLFAASAAIAQNPRFEELDADGDGYISKTEARALPCLSDAFEDIDKQSDQGLSRGEYNSAVQQHCSKSEGESDWPQS